MERDWLALLVTGQEEEKDVNKKRPGAHSLATPHRATNRPFSGVRKYLIMAYQREKGNARTKKAGSDGGGTRGARLAAADTASGFPRHVTSGESPMGWTRGTMQGAFSCNTPPASSITTTGGEDTARVGFAVDWGEGWGTLSESLKAAKQQAADGELDLVPLVLGGVLLVVRPHGRRAGSGSGPYFAFQFEHAGLRFAVMNRNAPENATPNVFADYGSVALMDSGFNACHNQAMALIRALGGEVLCDLLSRADVCADLPGVSVSEFTQALNERRWITRARKVAVYYDGAEPTGISFGMGGAVSCRIYDKLTESRHDERKFSLLVERRWGFVPESAVRVEFQLRRDALTSLGVRTVADYIRCRAEICAYLCENWLRMAADPVDRENNHQTLAENAPLWDAVRTSFSAWASPPSEKIVRNTRKPLRSEGLLRQAAGCLVSAVVRSNDAGVLYDTGKMYRTCSRLLWATLNHMDLEKVQIDKSLRWHASGPSALGMAVA